MTRNSARKPVTRKTVGTKVKVPVCPTCGRTKSHFKETNDLSESRFHIINDVLQRIDDLPLS